MIEPLGETGGDFPQAIGAHELPVEQLADDATSGSSADDRDRASGRSDPRKPRGQLIN